MSERKPNLTPAVRAEAEAVGESLEKVKRHRPRWDDYVSEGIIDSVPEPDVNGECRARVNGHDGVVKMLKMNEEANRLASWHGDNQAESSNRRDRREERVEKKARKFHKPRTSIVVPDLPWKRKKENA